MARPIWSGSISFGLVNIPIKAYTATRDRGTDEAPPPTVRGRLDARVRRWADLPRIKRTGRDIRTRSNRHRDSHPSSVSSVISQIGTPFPHPWCADEEKAKPVPPDGRGPAFAALCGMLRTSAAMSDFAAQVRRRVQ